MKLRPIETNGPQINLVPILDSIFILIFFFMMILMQKSQNSEIKLSLPSATKNPDTVSSKSLMISLDTSGGLFLENQALSKKSLQRELSLIRIEQPNLPITIQGDKNVNLGFVIEILDLVKRNGFKNVMIQTSVADQAL